MGKRTMCPKWAKDKKKIKVGGGEKDSNDAPMSFKKASARKWRPNNT